MIPENILASPAAKTAASSLAGIVAGFIEPIVAPALLCTVMTFIDFGTALALGRRLRRAGRPADPRLSSRRFGRVVMTLVRIYGALTVAAMANAWVVRGYAGIDAVRIIAGAICFWQLLSILENESTCSTARWALLARKFLVDKAKRHLGEF